MARRLLITAIVFFVFITAKAQTHTISGTITDQQTRTPLARATVQLKSLSDSSAHLSTTDSAGRFSFGGLRKDSFLLSISFIGYNPVSRIVALDTADIALNIAAATNSNPDLATIIIQTSISPVSQKGDTLQVSASQFKVNPDASSEDLLKKVPGITVENGQVKAMGENVQKVTLDGRDFFGDDATAALRNLPAEVIDKIQIFDRLSDQAQFTGFDDGNTTKSINIVTKANMRNGQFGRVFAGYGTDNRYSAGGNATILKDNRRISLVGNFNNTNQQNFSQQDLLGVTSNNQRGGGGNRGGGGGAPRGGGGAPRGGGGGGNFGSGSNFLVGQQNGINKTNAFGINYSDLWGPKVTATGSYFFNNSNNNTNEIANTQYFSGATTSSVDSTLSNSKNNNHRFNVRFEYRIDSSNQLIITPNLSFQDNTSTRYVGRDAFLDGSSGLVRRVNQNTTNSSRNGNNLNNTVLYRHSFPKRGRSLSINLNTSYNKNDGDSYVNTFQRSFTSTNFSDSSSATFSDQASHGFQVSTNIAYTEPLGPQSQLQINYNPSFSKSSSNQQTFGFNPIENKYSDELDSLSNRFDNQTRAQNAGLSYRHGNRDKQISFGVSYQHTTLNSDQTFPQKLTINKSFDNVLPNAMIRYKLSTRSSVRIFYRANVNQPSVNQLQNVLNINNAPYYSIGNPDLNPQYMQSLSTQYTFTNTGKGLLLVGNIFWQTARNYITSAVFSPRQDSIVEGKTLSAGDQLTKPVNLDGYSSLRSFLTFAVPVKFIKSNFNLNGGITYTQLPGIIDNLENKTRNTTYTLGVVVASNVSQYVDFTVSYSANFNKVENALQAQLNDHYFQHVASLQLNLLSKKGWFFQNDLNNQFYSGLSQGFNQSYFLWNMSAGKKILKDQKGELKLSVFDLLKQNRSIIRSVETYGIVDTRNDVLRQYFMLTFTYNLRNFGTAAARAMNRNNSNGGNTRF
jgi:hypothetical protein